MSAPTPQTASPKDLTSAHADNDVLTKHVSRGRLRTAPLRTLPDFVIIGAQRAGTTSLYDYIIQHPDVHKSAHKELHYFDLNFARGAAWYRAHFPYSMNRILAAARGRKFVTGEATPYYLFHPLAAERAAATIPQAKIIAILRNPVSRAYSHFNRVHNNAHEKFSFEQGLQMEEERLRGEKEKFRADPNYYSYNHRKFSYVARGRYAEQLAPWMNRFPRERMLILSTERLNADPQSVVSRVFDFLGLDNFKLKKFERHHETQYEKMKPETRARLVEIFRPHNEALFNLIGERFDWDG